MKETIQGVVQGDGEKKVYVVIADEVYLVKEMVKVNAEPEEVLESVEKCKKCGRKIITLTMFPRVFVNKRAGNNGLLYVVYRKRVESYEFRKSETKVDIDKGYEGEEINYEYEDIFGKGWNASHEIDVLESNGFKEIHAGRSKPIHACGVQ
ncbi:MAG: hypothetical protein AABY22_35920 [Nanoarchaeota archaeon]